jgi:hypothetical protein
VLFLLLLVLCCFVTKITKGVSAVFASLGLEYGTSERRKRVAHAEAQRPLRVGGDGIEPEEIGFVFDFKYLSHWFQSDGDGMRSIEIRMAQAGSEFGRLNHIWRDNLSR